MWGAPIEALTITLPANDEVSNAALAELPVKVIAVDNTLLIVSVTEASIQFLIVEKRLFSWHVVLRKVQRSTGASLIEAVWPMTAAFKGKSRLEVLSLKPTVAVWARSIFCLKLGIFV